MNAYHRDLIAWLRSVGADDARIETAGKRRSSSMSGRTAMSERERQAAERQALLNGYLAAYRRLRPNGPDLDLSFERGWWIFREPLVISRVRTTEFVAMKKSLETILERRQESGDV